MRLYAIENACCEPDITSVRHTKLEVVELIKERFGDDGGDHLFIVEYDDKQDSLGDALDGFFGCLPLSIHVEKSVVRTSYSSNGELIREVVV